MQQLALCAVLDLCCLLLAVTGLDEHGHNYSWYEHSRYYQWRYLNVEDTLLLCVQRVARSCQEQDCWVLEVTAVAGSPGVR